MNQASTAGFAGIMQVVTDTVGWPSLCSIYQPLNTLDALGQPNLDPADSTPVTGLQDLECRMAPLDDQRPNPTYEDREQQYIAQLNVMHVLINGYYPAIQQQQLARVDGEYLNILNVETDSQAGVMTRLAVRRFSY